VTARLPTPVELAAGFSADVRAAIIVALTERDAAILARLDSMEDRCRLGVDVDSLRDMLDALRAELRGEP
jgi:hypothetical protein